MVTIGNIENDEVCGEFGVLDIKSYQLIREGCEKVVVNFSDGKMFKSFLTLPDDKRKEVIDNIRNVFSNKTKVLLLPPGMSIQQHIACGGVYQ